MKGSARKKRTKKECPFHGGPCSTKNCRAWDAKRRICLRIIPPSNLAVNSYIDKLGGFFDRMAAPAPVVPDQFNLLSVLGSGSAKTPKRPRSKSAPVRLVEVSE